MRGSILEGGPSVPAEDWDGEIDRTRKATKGYGCEGSS